MSDPAERGREQRFQNDDRSSVPYRVGAANSSLPAQSNATFRPRVPHSVVVHGTSGGRSSHQPSVRTPNLTLGPTASSASVKTAEGVKSLSRHAQPPPPPPPAAAVRHPLECTFDRLGCDKTFASFDAWVAHTLTYFPGKGPPDKPTCPFRCSTPFLQGGESPKIAWNMRMKHVLDCHIREGHQLADAPIDDALYRYLWSCGRIDQATFKDVKLGRRVDQRPVAMVNEPRRRRE